MGLHGVKSGSVEEICTVEREYIRNMHTKCQSIEL